VWEKKRDKASSTSMANVGLVASCQVDGISPGELIDSLHAKVIFKQRATVQRLGPESPDKLGIEKSKRAREKFWSSQVGLAVSYF
jgi:hypothetical protein